MNKSEFLLYIEENFNITGESYRLISNILDFVSNNATNENEQYNMLYNLLDGTIGLLDMELRKVYLYVITFKIV